MYGLGHLRCEFPHAVRYQRFVELIPSTIAPLYAYWQTCFGTGSRRSFIDSTALAVGHNRRIPHHRVFRDLAERGFAALEANR